MLIIFKNFFADDCFGRNLSRGRGNLNFYVSWKQSLGRLDFGRPEDGISCFILSSEKEIK